MTDRERLIELLDGKSIDTQADVEYVADYLLENGVIVPPCKVGDTVYELDDFVWAGDCGECDNFDEGCYAYPSECRKTKSDKKSPECIEIIEQKISYSKLLTSMIGKDFGEKIFLTREEVEKALTKLKEGDTK